MDLIAGTIKTTFFFWGGMEWRGLLPFRLPLGGAGGLFKVIQYSQKVPI